MVSRNTLIEQYVMKFLLTWHQSYLKEILVLLILTTICATVTKLSEYFISLYPSIIPDYICTIDLLWWNGF